MSWAVEVFGGGPHGFAAHAAAAIASVLPGSQSIVVTGGRTAAAIYPHLAEVAPDWSDVSVYFSDERCVPPDDPASNYGAATRLLLDAVRPHDVHRMRGEDDPRLAAAAYHDECAHPIESGGGFDLALLGLGGDAHIAALSPGSPALAEPDRYCIAVARPDGLGGLTLTPPALLSARRIVVLAAGTEKADAVRRAVASDEPPDTCPARVLAGHPAVQLLADEDAASQL